MNLGPRYSLGVPFPRKNLNEGESLILDLHPHWWFYSRDLLGASVAGIAALSVLTRFDGTPEAVLGALALALVTVAGARLAVRVVKWRTTYFVVTSRRVIYRDGVVAREGVEIPLERVNNVNFAQTIIERLIGVGDILIESGGQDGQQTFTDIGRPMEVQNLIHQALQDYRDGRDRAAGPGVDVAGQLERLEALRDRGTLSDDEFDEQKRRLLG